MWGHLEDAMLPAAATHTQNQRRQTELDRREVLGRCDEMVSRGHESFVQKDVKV